MGPSTARAEPDYTHHCFVVAAREQFFVHAVRSIAPPSTKRLSQLIDKIVSRSPRKEMRMIKSRYSGYATARVQHGAGSS